MKETAIGQVIMCFLKPVSFIFKLGHMKARWTSLYMERERERERGRERESILKKK
jgi:hypothetical protein